MQIKRSIANDGNLFPRGLNVLAAVPDCYTYHSEHGHRHPRSAYGTSLRAITDQWLITLDCLDHLNTEHNWHGTEECFPTFLREYRELLSRLNEHFDACYSALRSLCRASAARTVIFDSKFLNQVKFPGWKQFQEATKLYREGHIAVLANTLKHRQGELCPIFFHSTTEFRPGYYLRDVLPDGSLGPSPKLHSSGQTAFSISRDMLMHLWWLYRIGELLSTTVETCLRVWHSYEVVEKKHDLDAVQWNEVVRRCAKLRPEFFPDEISKPYPRILFQESPCAISLEFPTSLRGHAMGDIRVSTMITVDGDHLTNTLPYFSSFG